MTSAGEQAKLPLYDAWLARRDMRISAMAHAHEAERLLGGPQNIQAAVREFISGDVGMNAAISQHLQSTADLDFYSAVRAAHPDARVRTIMEDRANPNGRYQFVVQHGDEHGLKRDDWYTFEPISDQELLERHKALFPPAAETNMHHMRVKPPKKPRRR